MSKELTAGKAPLQPRRRRNAMTFPRKLGEAIPELHAKEKAARNLKEAVRLFLEEAARMGTLDQILRRGGLR